MQVLLALWEFPNFISTSCCEPSGPPEGKDCTVEAAQGARRSGSQRRLQTVQLVCLGRSFSRSFKQILRDLFLGWMVLLCFVPAGNGVVPTRGKNRTIDD